MRSDQSTDNFLLQHYRNRFPEVFDGTLRSKTILHLVEATVEITSNEFVHPKVRHFDPDNFFALKTKTNSLLEAGVVEPNHSEFSSSVVLVFTKNGLSGCVPISQTSTIS